MQTKLIRLAIGLISACAAGSALAQVKWAQSYQAAMNQAKGTNKLVMVEFYTAWDINSPSAANWSGRMEKETFGDKKVQALVDKVIPVRLDVEKDGKDLGKKFHITNYPTVLFLDKNGNDVGTIDGFEGPDEFIKHVNVFLQDYASQAKLEAKYKAKPKDLATIAGLGIIEANRYHIAAAVKKVGEAESVDPKNKTGKLSDLYNAVADHYQNASKFDDAIRYFKKAADTSKITDKKAYALLSIATCYMTMDNPKDPAAGPTQAEIGKLIDHLKAALPYIEQTLKLPNLKEEDRKIAENDKATIERVLGGG